MIKVRLKMCSFEYWKNKAYFFADRNDVLVRDKNNERKGNIAGRLVREWKGSLLDIQTLVSSRSMEFWSRAAGEEERLKLQVQMCVLLGAICVFSWLCQFPPKNKAMRWKWRWGIWWRMFEERGKDLKYSSYWMVGGRSIINHWEKKKAKDLKSQGSRRVI